MKLTGSYKLNVKKEIVWQSLNDSNILKKCIPGCESFKKENDKLQWAKKIYNVLKENEDTIKSFSLKKYGSYTFKGEQDV